MNNIDNILNSEKTYMNSYTVRHFKEVLLDKKTQIMEDLKESKGQLVNKHVLADMSDIATDYELRQQHLLDVKIKTKELKSTINALKLIEEGEYGYCQKSGNEIGIERLLINPTATLTVEEQSKEEFKLRTTGIRH